MPLAVGARTMQGYSAHEYIPPIQPDLVVAHGCHSPTLGSYFDYRPPFLGAPLSGGDAGRGPGSSSKCIGKKR